MFFLLRIDDYFKYKNSVSSKEEMFQMVYDEQEALGLLVQEMKDRLEQFEVTLDFTFCPAHYTYWGIYYTSDGKPSSWGGELEEVEGVFTESGSYYKYETEKITENWYYWQCMTR